MLKVIILELYSNQSFQPLYDVSSLNLLNVNDWLCLSLILIFKSRSSIFFYSITFLV